MDTPHCPIHHKPMILVCRSCRASKGGRSKSPAKKQAAVDRWRRRKVAALKAQGASDYQIHATLGYWPHDVSSKK